MKPASRGLGRGTAIGRGGIPPIGDCKLGHVHPPKGDCKPRPVYKTPLRRANYPQMLPTEPNERSFSYGHG